MAAYFKRLLNINICDTFFFFFFNEKVLYSEGNKQCLSWPEGDGGIKERKEAINEESGSRKEY